MTHRILTWSAFAIMAIVFTLFFRNAPPQPFGYDEADYVYAGSRGFLDNYLDRPSLPVSDFLRKGWELFRDRSKREEFSRMLRSSDDIMVYRHFHGPLYFYWLALCQLLGANKENLLRGCGLILHVITSIVILYGFRFVFPQLPPIAAWVASMAFLLNRTGILTSRMITQHLMYILFATIILLAMGAFSRDYKPKYWYLASAVLAMAFVTVETSFILLSSVLLSMAFQWKRLHQKYSVKEIAMLLVKGAGVCLLTILILWPPGLLQLNAIRGYLFLIYISISRGTFTTIGPIDLWLGKFTESPFEFALPILAILIIGLLWRHLTHRWELLPALTYVFVFFLVTMKITVPYTHYHGTMMAACAIVTGVAIGELWRIAPNAARYTALAITMTCLIAMNAMYYVDTSRTINYRIFTIDVLEYMKTAKVPEGQTLMVPYILVPALHYYHPEIKTVGYDTDWALPKLQATMATPNIAKFSFCESSACRILEKVLGENTKPQYQKLTDTGPSHVESLYAITW